MIMRCAVQTGCLILISTGIAGTAPVALTKALDPVPGQSLTDSVRPSLSISPAQAQHIIADKANSALLYLKTGNMTQLARLVHPKQGLRFSPYGHIQSNHGVFKRATLALLSRSQKVYHWGEYDGSGEPIRLNYQQYQQKFVFDRDFSKAKNILYNQPQQRGNSLNNIQDFYPHSIVVEYYLPATATKSMDWRNLTLIFQPYRNNWYLVGVVHDQWTI